MRAVESLKYCSLMGSFCPVHIKFQVKNYKRVMCHNTEEWCKVWRKTDSWFQEWHEEFGEFQYEQWQVWKFELWCSIFVESILYLSQKKKRPEKLCVITLENLRRNWLDFEKICGGTDLCSEKWQEFAEFWPNTRKSQNVAPFD